MLKQIVITHKFRSNASMNSVQIYRPEIVEGRTLWRDRYKAEMPYDYAGFAKYLVSGGGNRMSIDFGGMELIIEPIYETRNAA